MILRLTAEDLSKLTDGTIISMALDLGCPVEFPVLRFTGDTFEENNQKVEDYIIELKKWLKNEGYLVENGRVLCR